MIRKHKSFAWPKKLFDKPRILEENKLVAKYGLKNKKEIWKAEAKIKYFRSRAKDLITAKQDEQQKFFNKLKKTGLKVDGIADVLALDKEDLLKRRLPTILVEKKIANKPKQARQMVIHKRVLISGKIVNIPSYLVKVDEENSIVIRKIKKTVKKVSADSAGDVPENEPKSEPEASETIEVKNA